MQIAINNQGVVKAACNLVKRVDDSSDIKYYCIHCGIEVIPRIGERGLSHFAKHNEVLHKPGCPEIYLNSSVKLPSSNSKFLVGNAPKEAILKNLSVLNLDDLIFKVDVKDLLVNLNNFPEFNNKQTYVIVTQVDNVSGNVIGLKKGLKLIVEDEAILQRLKKDTKFMLLTPIVEKHGKGNNISNYYFYDDMPKEVQTDFDIVMNK